MDKSPILKKSYGIDCRFTGIATRSRGCVENPGGIDVEKLIKLDAETGRLCVKYPVRQAGY